MGNKPSAEQKHEINYQIEEKFITNHVIINIGISIYKHTSNLKGCKSDIDTMNELWINKYKFKTIDILHLVRGFDDSDLAVGFD